MMSNPLVAALKINVFSVQNGKGLELDRCIINEALTDLGCEVYSRDLFTKLDEQAGSVDINIFFEHLSPSWFPKAKVNWFIPNPEFYVQDRALLDQIDLVLCRTRFVEKIFSSLNKNTYFIGFTSTDCYNPDIKKASTRCLHLAGGSPFKGTQAVIGAWASFRKSPFLIAVRHNVKSPFFDRNVQWISKKIPLSRLRTLQNRCGIHLCPSQAEGFGHYIMEAMSTKAVVITTDAPPMNEFITDRRCLVPCKLAQSSNLAYRFFVDSQDLQKTVQKVMSLSPRERQRIGKRNRAQYRKITREFYRNIRKLIQKTSKKLAVESTPVEIIQVQDMNIQDMNISV